MIHYKKSLLERVNVEEALELMDGYEQIYQKVVESFLDNQSHLIEEVRENYISNNYDEARRLVHSCKGIAPNLGAKSLHEIAKDLELAILNKDFKTIDKLFPQFKQIFNQVINELKTITFD